MALLWIDGFDSYGDTNGGSLAPTGIVARKYTATGTGGDTLFKVAAGRINGHSLDFSTSGAASYIRKTALTTNGTVVIGCGIKFPSLPSEYRFCYLSNDTGTIGIKFSILASGEIKVLNDRTGTILGTTSGAGIIAGNWAHFEAKVTVALSGSVIIKVNGIQVGSFSGDTRDTIGNNYSSAFNFNGVTSSWLLDDLYFLDSTGSTNNDFLGNMTVSTLRPSANGDSTQWTPDSGINYARINESQCVDASYVQDGTSNDEDLYSYDDLIEIAGSIKGVQISTIAEQTTANALTLKLQCKSNGTDSDGIAQNVIGTSAFKTYTRMLEVDPGNANAAWTETTVNAAQFGIKVG